MGAQAAVDAWGQGILALHRRSAGNALPASLRGELRFRVDIKGLIVFSGGSVDPD